jgi:hypothetical protein
MKAAEKLTKEEFELGLKQFIGTSQYWKHECPGSKTLLLTDGCNYVRQEGDARWLFDMLAVLQKERIVYLQRVQHWQLTRLYIGWVLELRGYDGQTLLPMRIDNSDFPIDELDIWICDGVALLPSEY